MKASYEKMIEGVNYSSFRMSFLERSSKLDRLSFLYSVDFFDILVFHVGDVGTLDD